MGGVIAPSGCHVSPWCGDREGWLPWWRPGTVEPFLRPAGGPDIGIDPGSRRPGGLPRPALPDACVAADPRIDPGRGSAVAGTIAAAGGKARFVAADLTDPAQLDRLSGSMQSLPGRS